MGRSLFFAAIFSEMMFKDFGRYEFVGTSKLRMPYRLLAPRELSFDAKYPLVVLFHGSGERGNDNE